MPTDAILTELAERHGTPTYVYDLEEVGRQLDALQRALPQARLHYAVKANPSGAVLSYLAGRGLGVEAITLGELERALLAGFAPENILLGGPRQDPPLIRRALEAGVRRVSIDSSSQASLWEEHEAPGVDFLPRINPALDPRTHEHLATGAAESKFGMPASEAQAVAETLQARGRLQGFHVHAGSQISELGVYDEIFAVLAPLYELFPDARTLDLGGGFAVPGFDVTTFAKKVTAFVERFGLSLVLEPGRYLIAPAGVLLTRVLHVKDGPLRHVIVDAGMADLIRPALYGAQHPVRALGKSGAARRVDVDGPLCENADRLGRELDLPAVCPGDLLVVEQAGAYGMAMASNYASSFRPAEVVLEGGRARLARRRETIEDLVRLERA
ncbi:MAG TPA: diaminopimelate decarboxylase [Trueperaceae bacterium]